MTELPTSPPTTVPEPDRADAIARAKALQARRSESGAKPKSSTPSRILVAGAAASSGMLLVAAMASAAGAGTTASPSLASPQVVERVVVIEVPAPGPAAVDQPAAIADTGPIEEITVVREVRVIPAPAQNPTPAPAPTQGS